MRLFEEYHQDVLRHCAEFFSEDFVFVCAGTQANPIAGTFQSLSGFQTWLNTFFGIFTRSTNHQLNPTLFTQGQSVVVSYQEVVVARGYTSPPIWVNLHFLFNEGRIERLRDEYDTQTGAEFLAQVVSSSGPLIDLESGKS
ncbi:hypothetical protein Pla22_31690 [Rubripirellula amarantea]|uniref:SnoaL-like domain protein n=1 Tax=Rubripirellula amarantea TaxID=2527999 RepID=A0A5C5WI01_9BACT|nr:hypothetical protein [Rubripirellula amarantea]TWT50426.1 hypothetical protein Pla22_31690 [Rubripirellula amarantea]